MFKNNLNLLIVFLVLCTTYAFAQPSPPRGKQWTTVEELSDEFNGNRLNPDKWFDYHPHWAGRPPSKFKKGNAFVRGGYLQLRSTLMKDPSTVRNPLKDIWVNAAACVSKEKSAKPGYYYEAKFKASSLSMTSSFWFRVGQFSEIDVIEHIGNPSKANRQDDLPFEYAANTHYYGKHQGLKNKKATWKMPTRGRDKFHIYGFWWKSPTELIFYFDNKEVMRIRPRVPLDEDLKMIFDTEVFPFAQAGVTSIGLPKVKNLNDNSKNTMLVDWVRVYKLENGTSGPPSTGNRIANGTYHIKKSSSNLYLNATARAGNVSSVSSTSRSTQWDISHLGNNEYSIVSKAFPGSRLEVPLGKRGNGNLIATTAWTGNAQHIIWKAQKHGNSYLLSPKHDPSVALDFLPSSNQVHTWGKSVANANQLISLVRVGGGSNRGTYTVNARGVDGSEKIKLTIGGRDVKTWGLAKTLKQYSTTSNLKGEVRIEYINDKPGRDAFVDYLRIGNTVLQAESQAINTARYANGKCNGGGRSSLMNCSGYISFGNNQNLRVADSELEDSKLSTVYTNPVDEELFFGGLQDEKVILQVRDAMGRMLTEKALSPDNGGNVRMNVQNLKEGLYFISLQQQDKKQLIRIMKK